jgi:hypothetical protein
MAVEAFNFAGIANAEARDRINEARSGVPSKGNGQALLSAPANRTAKVGAMNVGDNPCVVRARHGSATKTQTNEHLVALGVAGNRFVGKLAFGKIVKGSMSITNAGAPATIVDDSAGNLVDTGTTTKRGTIDYVNGIIDFTYGAGPTKPVRATYQHTDYSDFDSPAQTTVKATGAVTPSGGSPFTVQLGFGRVNPGSISIVDGGTFTFVDDGKGNLVQTDVTASTAKVGTVDYTTGLLTFTSASGALTGNMTVTYKFNPFATALAGGGGQKGVELFPGAIPELSSAAWAAGIKSDANVALWGEGTSGSLASALIGQFSHFGDEPYRVTEDYSGFPAGGASNDTRVL